MPHLLTSIPSGALSGDELESVLTDYLALDGARIFRRLLVVRCGLLALLASVIGVMVPTLPTTARWLPAVLFLATPVCAWVYELRLESRLATRLDGVDGVVTRDVSRSFQLDDC